MRSSEIFEGKKLKNQRALPTLFSQYPKILKNLVPSQKTLKKQRKTPVNHGKNTPLESEVE